MPPGAPTPINFPSPRALSLTDFLEETNIRWHGIDLDRPDWGLSSRTVAFTVEGALGWFQVILNAYWDQLAFKLPRPPEEEAGGRRRIIDTSLDSPDNIRDPAEAPAVPEPVYHAAPRSVVLLFALSS